MHSTTELSNCRVFTIVTGDKWKENCYLVQFNDSNEGILIDPGDNTSDIIEIIRNSGCTLRRVLLTHAHFDHVGAVASIGKEFDLPCEIHPEDARLLRQAPIYALRFAGKRIETPQPIQLLQEGVISMGNHKIKVLHTPGHTPGSVCYQFDEVIFTGDTLLYQRVGRTDMPGGDAVCQKETIDWLLQSLSDRLIMFPGHGVTWTIAEAKKWWLSLKGSPAEHNDFGL